MRINEYKRARASNCENIIKDLKYFRKVQKRFSELWKYLFQVKAG